MKFNLYCRIIYSGICLLFLATIPANAQFSVMIAGSLEKPIGAPKDYPSLLGFNPRITMDIGKKHQVGIYGNLAKPVTWSGGGMLPQKASKGMGVLELNVMYSYYFWHQNYSDLAAYGSAGPGMVYYNSNFTSITSALPHNCADLVLDMRVGAQAHVAIGYLFLEGKFAPRVVSIHHLTDEKRYGPLVGMNLGLRFLLNRHPLCTN